MRGGGDKDNRTSDRVATQLTEEIPPLLAEEVWTGRIYGGGRIANLDLITEWQRRTSRPVATPLRF
jgi:hypothetical protein